MAADSNVVGYNTVRPDGAYYMLGFSFTECQTGDARKLDKLVGAFTSGDQIQLPITMPDGVQYDFVIYQYLTLDDDGMPDGWYDGSWGYIGDDVELPQGDGAWYYSATGLKDVTVAGEVSKALFSKTFVGAYTMTATGFPVEFNPNDSKFMWSMSSGDQIQVPFTMAGGIQYDFDIYQYLTLDDDGMPDGWYDGSWGLIDTAIAGIGQGFWVYSQNGGSMLETSPIAD